MTIEEIKEWREQGIAGADYNKGELFEIIDTLLAEVDRLNDCKGCDAPRQLAVATEALERIADLPHLSAPLSYHITRTALERIKG